MPCYSPRFGGIETGDVAAVPPASTYSTHLGYTLIPCFRALFPDNWPILCRFHCMNGSAEGIAVFSRQKLHRFGEKVENFCLVRGKERPSTWSVSFALVQLKFVVFRLYEYVYILKWASSFIRCVLVCFDFFLVFSPTTSSLL